MKSNKNKIAIKIEGIESAILVFKSFKEFKSRCSSNGANLDPITHFEHACKPSVCVNWFSKTTKCKKADCPILKLMD